MSIDPTLSPNLRPRVFIAEDEAMISITLGHMLEDLGCDMVGPATSLEEAVAMTRAGEIDCALVNGDLRNEPTFALADLLDEMRVPFALCTGYGDAAIREADKRGPVLRKPFAQPDLARVLAELGAILPTVDS